MAVDITLLFKASVKTVKTRNKAMGVGFESSRDDVLKRSRSKAAFSAKAKEVVSNITKLKDFLLQHRKDYMNADSLISSDATRMTDSERDQIDQDAQIFMRTCFDAIRQLRNEAEKQASPAQVKEHYGAVLDLIEVYLKGVCKLYSEQRAIRVKRVGVNTSQHQTYSKHRFCCFSLWNYCFIALYIYKHLERTYEGHHVIFIDNLKRLKQSVNPGCVCVCVFQFEQENQRLVSEMNSLVDEVRQVEGKVVEISRLQEIFAEKVLQQETEINNIHQLVVGATENVKEGNEDIREAIKNNAGFRVWILFFLVMCSFSLLFLDWYDS
uniref:Syntaxin-18 n=1 Tax=Denticeps clupeoides TaxID=299321 RepID=A0AAY4B8U8_9TELE